MSNFVQLYKSTDLNAPVLTGQVGSLITLLNKCLVDGYTTASVTSITHSGTTATFTLASADTSLATGKYVTFSGATGGDASIYNVTAMVTMTNSTTGTYTLASAPSGNATGTLLYAKASLGWARPFSAGTNSQTYRSADTGSNRFYLQIVDNAATAGGAKEAQAYGAEVMGADQSVTSGQFPTVAQLASGLCWRKSTTADSTARPWFLWGDDKTFYLVVNSDASVVSGRRVLSFGHLAPFRIGDGYNTFVAGQSAFNNLNALGGAGHVLGTLGVSLSVATAGVYLARGYAQTGGAVQVDVAVPLGNGSVWSLGAVGPAKVLYPNGPDGALWVCPVYVQEYAASTPVYRGMLPGLYTHMHDPSSAMPINEGDTVTNVSGLAGTTLTGVTVCGASTQGLALVDTFGPW